VNFSHEQETLKGFQDEAVKSGVGLFAMAKVLLDAAGDDVASHKAAVNHNGYLLIEAPTGTGKTLIAGTIVEKFSHLENVVWFWFAPFKGVTGQTVSYLRESFKGLRLREISEDRATAGSRGGDVFVTTWQTVATRVKDKRNVRKESETNPSVDALITSLRKQGLRIGVVVDEAHHGFGGETQASEFFCETLKPEYTILVTATPDDKDVKAFEKAMGIEELQRISVSRSDAVSEGLIKMGVKCVAYFSDADKKALINLEATALRDAVAAHRRLKARLAELKIPLVPLLLVQADSDRVGAKIKNIDRLKEQLLVLGFTDEQIAVHTAEEPDSGLLALANDEKREVLLFKMSVAMGFDAPRAFTLVSMRASREVDFGVQLVGRILRVHRRLHAMARDKRLPEELNYGYVFLADPETQTGLDLAGQKINQIQTAYAKASASMVALRFGSGQPGLGHVDGAGQISFRLDGGDAGEKTFDGTDGDAAAVQGLPVETGFNFGQFFGGVDKTGETQENTQKARPPEKVAGAATVHRYPLRSGVPRLFKTQELGDNSVTEEDCAQRFFVSTRDLFEVVRSTVPVEKRTLDVFTQQIQQEFNFAAALSEAQAAKIAQDVLLKNKTFDARELRKALLRKMQNVMREETLAEAENPMKVAHFLNVILAARPKLLFEAQKAALAEHAQVVEAGSLLEIWESPEPLAASTRNIYGIFPQGLNSWETEFAGMLDRDPNKIINWWHRNEPHQPWSVNVLMPDGRGFYPDFIIGVEGRDKENGTLLADPKLNYQREEELPKILAEHKAYGRVMILYRDGEARWSIVGYNEKDRRPFLSREFRLSDAAGF